MHYDELTRGEIMWYRPNVKRIASDLRQMRQCGVNYVRPHYHHLKWFRDYLLFQRKRQSKCIWRVPLSSGKLAA